MNDPDPHDAYKASVEDAMIAQAEERAKMPGPQTHEAMAQRIRGESAKERPVLFSGPMVRAILEGRKTQTRRALKWCCDVPKNCTVPNCVDGLWYFDEPKRKGFFPGSGIECPFGMTGDHLWVKETFSVPFKGAFQWTYRADGQTSFGKWKPSIFMPRAFSRITLEITEVKVERLQEISGEDSIAEGIDYEKHKCGCEICSRLSQLCPGTESSLIMDYAHLWDSINSKKHPWASNPWVWVITFKRI